MPKTASPGLNGATLAPTASTTPATSAPSLGNFGLRIPMNRRMTDGVPRRKCQSDGFTEAE